jgi:hypothetical protein
MMKERLLAKARDLIAARLEQAQVRRGNGVVIRNSDRNTIEIDPDIQGGKPTLARREYRAGEIVTSGNGVKVAPFMIKVYYPCSPEFGTTGYPAATGSPSFMFKIPTINGVRIDASTAPILSTANSGAVYLKTGFAWGGWTGPAFLYPAYFYYYLISSEIVTYPLGDDPLGADGPFDQLMAEIATPLDEDYISYSWAFQYAHTYSMTLLGWWERGDGVFQSIAGDANVNFGTRFTSSNTTPEDTRVIVPNPPTAYIS